jgi:hypothetical protein
MASAQLRLPIRTVEGQVNDFACVLRDSEYHEALNIAWIDSYTTYAVRRA